MKGKTASQSRVIPFGAPVGILGGGQLARMLSLAAYELGLEPWVLSKNSSDPAALVTPNWIQGDPGKTTDVSKLARKVRHITFESEFFAMKPLQKFAQKCAPSPRIMAQLQDRRSQKQTLVKFRIPTSRYINIDKKKDLERILSSFPKGCVLKKAQGGYDGYGTYMIRSETDLDGHRLDWRGPYIAEEKIAFRRELAVMLFRNARGEFLSYPLVESQQRNSKCDLVWGPIRHKNETALVRRFKILMAKENYVGTLGVELFETEGRLLVNELAPRVHNSGHYSMDAFAQSQFHLHWKALLGLPLEKPLQNGAAFVMANLIGEKRTPMKIPGHLRGAVHWYGKNENRPGRKMGHLNYVGADLKALLKFAINERNRVRR